MKFNLNEELRQRVSDEIEVGDVYPAKGGRGDAVYWVVVGISSNWKAVCVLGIDKDGDVVQATRYNIHTLKERPRIGIAKGFAELDFEIEMI